MGAILSLGLASADTLKESYTAFLSPRDHVNSSGARLTDAAAIIRQDRANYHKFGKRDPADEGDRFFATAENRDRLEQLIRRGKSDPAALRLIVEGNPTVTVNIHEDAAGNDYVTVIVGGDGVSRPAGGVAGEVLMESYTAVLSDRDHFSSSGTRLKDAAAIIRQDRANYHKFGKRDRGDGGDRFFASAENRGRLERLLGNGRIDRATSRAIIAGPTVVTVHIFQSPSGGNHIAVVLAE